MNLTSVSGESVCMLQIKCMHHSFEGLEPVCQSVSMVDKVAALTYMTVFRMFLMPGK